MVSRFRPLLALGKLTLPFTGHFIKRVDPTLTSRESWPLHSGEMAPPLTTGEKELMLMSWAYRS